MIERTLVILKPDAVQRNLVGELIQKFEKKGLKLVAMKLSQLTDEILDVHYAHHKDKPFFKSLKDFMKSAPVILMVLEGPEAVSVVRLMIGITKSREAQPGTIRGDYAISTPDNLVHASDSLETAQIEVKRFFKPEELYSWNRANEDFFTSNSER
ncbi:Nucleoside diphosphate kinase [uncultured archaeon]|nr:Nucleoside diphosphate kinase [uncultured archaeon]